MSGILGKQPDMPIWLRSRITSAIAVTLLLVLAEASVSTVFGAELEPGFQSIFDERSLVGWSARNAAYWSVEEGAITARITKERPCGTNQYLVWTGGELADFELKLEFRLNGEGGMIGAETDGNRVVRHFHGEVEEAAILPRALTDAEVAALGR